MKVIKKINNNVAKCVDSQGKELIALGKGIGFPDMPYDLTDLTKIDMTFYKLDGQFQALLSELPEEVINLAAHLVQEAQASLAATYPSTFVFSLADHINFALKRHQEFKDVKILFAQDIAQLYPRQFAFAQRALKEINQGLAVELPASEAYALALHFINSLSASQQNPEEERLEEVLEIIAQMVEKGLQVHLERDEFNFQRFQAHLRYYLKQTRRGECLLAGDDNLLQGLRLSQPAIYDLAQQVLTFIDLTLGLKSSDDELLYLMIHINRLYEKSQEGEKKDV